MKKLIIPTIKTFFVGAVMLRILLFVPAWTINYWQAWVFIVVFMTSTNIIGVYLSLKGPELLERRKNFGPKAEQKTEQKIIISFSIAGSLLMVLSAIDYRFGWSIVPSYVSLTGDGLVALGLLIDLLVFKENS